MSFLERFDTVAAAHQGLAHARDLAAAGIPSSTLVRARRRGDVTRVLPRVHARAPLPPWPRYLVAGPGPDPDFVLHVRAHLLARGPAAAARGSTAAALLGWGLLSEPRAVELGVPHGRRGTTGPVTRVRDPHVGLVRALPGTCRLQVTTPLTTALDLAGALPPREAVVAVDSALRSGLVCLDELGAARRPGLAGQARVHEALRRCDSRAGSVLESCARFDLVAARLTGFVTQFEVTDRAGVMRVDFCWPEVRLVLEVDGARWHPDPGRDQLRDNRLAALGYRVVRLTWRQVVGDPRWWEVIARALAEPGRT